jgi:hypothetical protein
MPSLVGRRDLNEPVCGGGPFTGGILPSEGKSAGGGAGETAKKRGNVLAPPPLWIDDGLYFFSKVMGRYGRVAITLPPSPEQVDNTQPAGVIRLEGSNALDRIATS